VSAPRFWCGLLLVAYALASNPARATVINGLGGAGIEYVSGGAIISDGSGVTFQGRTWEQPSARVLRAAEALKANIGGKALEFEARRVVPAAAVEAAAARGLARLLPGVGIALLAADVYDIVRVHPDDEGGLLWDPGTAQTLQSAYCENNNVFPGLVGVVVCGSTAAALADTLVGVVGPFGVPARAPSACSVLSGTVIRCVNSNGNLLDVGYFESSAPLCPASIDASNPAFDVPAGSPVGPDGKCPTARYNHVPITPEDAGAKLETHAPPDWTHLRDLAEEVLTHGGTLDGLLDRVLNGPASQPLTPTTTTTTNPDGSTVTTTKTPTVNYHYDGAKITYNTTTVTTINNAGDVTTTTETEGELPPEKDPCKVDPDSLGCSKMGDPPTDEPQWQTVDVPFAAEDIGGAAACPAPVTWHYFGIDMNWSYAAVCDVAPQIRIALVLMATIGAIGIIFRETSA